MRIALAQLNFTVGDFENNTARMLGAIARAKEFDANLVVFPELAVCGYPPRDFLEFAEFNRHCLEAALTIAESCTGITAIVGLPVVNPQPEGKNLFNAAAVLRDGKIISTTGKALLPTYDIFDEYRYFEPSRTFNCVDIDGVKIALTICEDLWNMEDDPMYVSSPMESLIAQKPQLMINIAASPFDYQHAEKRKAILLRNVNKYRLPLLYVNHVGAQTEIIFDGGSLAFHANGSVCGSLSYFEEDLAIFDYDSKDGSLTADSTHTLKADAPEPDAMKRIYDALLLGIRDYFRKTNFKKAILGLSGGIDSAIVTCLAADALGPENVLVLLMPSEYSSEGSVTDSDELIRRTGVKSELIRINNIYDQYLDTLKPVFGDAPMNVTEENLQARIRGALLMAVSNKHGYILLNTSNKSELAVGYGTLYGDMCGGLSVIGDLYKTQVYDLARYINREREILPHNIITKPPSAELRPDQKDTDSLPDYSILDKVLYNYIEQRKGASELVTMGFDEALVRRTLKLVNTSEYKRYQTPPILRVSPKAFGMGRRLPIAGKYPG